MEISNLHLDTGMKSDSTLKLPNFYEKKRFDKKTFIHVCKIYLFIELNIYNNNKSVEYINI